MRTGVDDSATGQTSTPHAKPWFGASKKVVTGFMWDPVEREITMSWADGTGTTSWRVRQQTEQAEEREDREAVQIAVDLFAGTQSMRRFYRQKKGVEYVPLDAKGHVFSAAPKSWV